MINVVGQANHAVAHSYDDARADGAILETKPAGGADDRPLLRPSLRDGFVLANVQLTEIERRLPESATEKEAVETAIPVLPPAPPLREGPAGSLVLLAVEIYGATAYRPEEFAPLYENLLARPVTMDDVASLTGAITETYRRDGYFLSRAVAPAQSVDDGVLRINIQEGYLKAVVVKGDAPQAARRRLKALKDEKPLRLSTLERTLLLVSDLSGVSVSDLRITPDPLDLAAHMLTVDVDIDQFEADVYIDNRGTEDAGPLQAYASASVNSIVRTGDRLKAGFFTIPEAPGELILGDLSYQLPITDSGAYVTLSGLVSRFDAGALLAALDTEIRTKQIAMRLSYPFIRTRNQSLWGDIAFEGRDIEEEQLGAPQFEDKLRIVSAAANYRRDYWNGVTTLSAEASRGLNMFGASAGDASLSRPDADGSFTKIEGQVARYQNIGKTFGVYAAAAGQVSFEPLLASEEFAVGGTRFGRAYDFAELTGDDGFATLVELRHGRDPGISILDFYQIYGFYDYGTVWNDNASPEFSRLSLSSAGVGLRLTFPAALFVTVEAARPLDRVPFTQNDRDWRGFFSVSKTF
ncbi:MAG: ShlB/FhaC/HecB family hemolysin secretion/activation protein [Pseudomonadota bacterium]